MKTIILFILLVSASFAQSPLLTLFDGVNLPDTTWENVVTNSEFTSNVDGWLDNSGGTPTIEWVAGSIHIIGNSATDGIYRMIPLVTGETYRLSFNITITANVGGAIRTAVFLGSYQKTADYYDELGTFTYSDTFVSNATGSAYLWNFETSNINSEWSLSYLRVEKRVITP